MPEVQKTSTGDVRFCGGGWGVGGGAEAMPREIKKKILMLDCLRLHFVRFEMSEIERQAGQDRP